MPPPIPSAASAAPPKARNAPPPAALAGAQTPSVPSAVDDLPAGSGFGRWLLVLAAAVVVVGVIGYRVLRRSDESARAPAPSPVALVAPPSEKLEPSLSAAAPAPEATPSAAVPVPEALPSTTAEPSAAVQPAAPAEAATGDLRSVTLDSVPPKARFYHFGKEVGTAPFVLQFKPGERHAYEVGLPGYITRKVVVDGSKPEITVGLRKETH